jgi:hypothetical protein
MGNALVFVVSVIVATVATQTPQYSSPPVITIPLDQPVDVRLMALNAQFASTFKADAEKELESVRQKAGKFLFFIGKTLLTFYMNVKGDPVIYDEIAELAAQTGVDFGDLVVYNYFYEAGCTSIVGMQSNPNSSVLFSSNLDFDHSSFIRKYSFQGIYTRNGQPVFIGDGIYGMVGVVRGQRINTGGSDFAIAINERDVQRGQLFVNLLFTQPTEVVYFIRKTLQLNSYADALNSIKNTVLTTAAYYTIAGTSYNDGCVVERSANTVHAVTCLNESTWFLVQTNYDRDLPDPSDDSRRTFAQNYLNNLGQDNFNTTSLMTLMMTNPILRVPTDQYRTISSIVCNNLNDPRQTSTWLMYLWNNLS